VKKRLICKLIHKINENTWELECEEIKAKKNLSPYNLFMQKCIKEKAEPIQERFKVCAMEYKKK